MSSIVSPDCRDQNHQKCPGDAWDEAHDHGTECQCGCHAEAAPEMPRTAMQARHLSGASIGKLIEWDLGRSLATGERQWSPIATLSKVSHGHEEVAIALQWDDYGIDEIDLYPDEWVRVTAPTPAASS